MAAYTKFLPAGVPSWQIPFWESLRAHEVKVQSCDDCGTFRYVPKELCNRCHSVASSWTPISGAGDVYTFTVVRRAPTASYQETAPYVIAHVAMNEGFRMVGSMPGVEPDEIRIGMPVHVVYGDVTPDWTILQFTLA